VVRGGVVVGSRHGRLTMKQGGASLFAAVRQMDFAGANAVVLRSVAEKLSLGEGGRHTSLHLGGEPVALVADESVLFSESEYTAPIAGNTISFEQAGKLAAGISGHQLEANWRAAWEALRLD
jgi:hypothetical protein